MYGTEYVSPEFRTSPNMERPHVHCMGPPVLVAREGVILQLTPSARLKASTGDSIVLSSLEVKIFQSFEKASSEPNGHALQ